MKQAESRPLEHSGGRFSACFTALLSLDLTVVDTWVGDFQMEDIHLPVDFQMEDSHPADSLAGEDSQVVDNLLVGDNLAGDNLLVGNNLAEEDSQVVDNLVGEDSHPLVPAHKLAFAVQQRCR